MLIKGELSFTKYVVCRKCHALYDFTRCQEKVGSRVESKSCTEVPFLSANKAWHSNIGACRFRYTMNMIR